MNETEEKMLEIAREVGLDHLQLHGDEQPALVLRLERTLPVIKAVRARKSFRPAQLSRFKRASAILLDGFDSRPTRRNGADVRLAARAACEIVRADFLGGRAHARECGRGNSRRQAVCYGCVQRRGEGARKERSGAHERSDTRGESGKPAEGGG